MKPPIPASYWVRPGRFLAGEYPGDWTAEGAVQKMSALRSAGVELFVDLTEERESLLPYTEYLNGAEHVRKPIVDVSIPARENMVEILDLLDDALEREVVPYVHCHGGIGRTGTVVGCWLARHASTGSAQAGGAGGEAGLRELRDLWKSCVKSAYCSTPQTPEQVRFVRNWRAGQ